MNLEREHTFILRLFWIVSILFSYGPIQYVNIIICAGSDSMIVSLWDFLLVSYSYFSALLRKLCILLSCPEYSWFVVLQVLLICYIHFFCIPWSVSFTYPGYFLFYPLSIILYAFWYDTKIWYSVMLLRMGFGVWAYFM